MAKRLPKTLYVAQVGEAGYDDFIAGSKPEDVAEEIGNDSFQVGVYVLDHEAQVDRAVVVTPIRKKR